MLLLFNTLPPGIEDVELRTSGVIESSAMMSAKRPLFQLRQGECS